LIFGVVFEGIFFALAPPSAPSVLAPSDASWLLVPSAPPFVVTDGFLGVADATVVDAATSADAMSTARAIFFITGSYKANPENLASGGRERTPDIPCGYQFPAEYGITIASP